MASPGVNPHVKAREKDVHWYKAHLDNDSVSESARLLLENYSKIAPDRVLSHILEIRERAWTIFPYPCIGQFRFLDLSISQSPIYQTILHRLIEDKHALLDLGCCFAQELRKLVSDGAPSENLYGAELRYDFVDLGYDLFCDRDTLRSRFIVGDVLDDSSVSAFKDVEGRFDIIYAASFFHLFNWDDQDHLARRVVKLLKPVKGSLLLGRQRGNVEPGEYEHRTNEKGTMFRHNEGSWKKMWEQVGESTGTSWDARAWLEISEDFGRRQEGEDEHANDHLNLGDRRLMFEVTRL